MSLSRAQIRAVITDRFERWQKHMWRENATPLMAIGLSHPENKFVITTIEEMSGEQIITLLEAAAALMRQGYEDHSK